MIRPAEGKTSRRNFLKFAAGTAAFGPFFLFPDRARASQQTLKIAKWAHFLPDYDQWFVNVLAKDWGQKNDTNVTVDIIPIEEIRGRAFVETKAGKGHDLFIFPWPPAEFSQHTIDHGEVYQSVAPRVGAIQQLAHRSTFNFQTKKYFGFADFWVPSPMHFFEDYWGAIGMPMGPVHYGGLLSGAKKIREQFGVPCGLAFSPTLEGNVTLHTILYASRAWIFDGRGSVVFNKNVYATVALKYIQTLYQQAGTPEQLTWSSAGNVRAMLAHKASCSINGISLLRTAEKENAETAKQIRLQPPLIGKNGMGITAMPHVTNCSAVWNFAQNKEGAKKFVGDLVDNSRTSYEQSKGCNFPIYPKTVPDIIVRLSKDPQADPTWKYTELQDALHWTPNLGVPGFATPAFMEIFNSSLVPRMVGSVLKGEQSPEAAASAAAAEIQRIVDKWNHLT
ncbi:MAG TPA: twin-arginine translocation signal domain-containing protein [Candidatus Angelobacter sp.]|nr:twin-arginine translocation signal domain-containing protein [Candidatus Angelobacter sp.]